MHANILRDWRRDLEYTKPDCEYSQAYWDLIPAHRRMTELEKEMELGMLQQERAEFHRRCKDNDAPGKRHMLPFYWRKERDAYGHVTEFKVPIKIGTPHYELMMSKIETKIKAVRER